MPDVYGGFQTMFDLRMNTNILYQDLFNLYLRKEVIQPHLPVRLPCYDLTLVTNLTLGACLLAVGVATSGATSSHGLTGGVYKPRERIHRCLLISDY